MAKKKNLLSRDTVRLLRKIQKFLIAEPRRFNMFEGVEPAEGKVGKLYLAGVAHLLEEPPCGTACCIAGAGYVIDKNLQLNQTSVPWQKVHSLFTDKYRLSEDQIDRLFYTSLQAGSTSSFSGSWPKLYSEAYRNAKTPLERACVGVARIEHFISTDGRE